MTKWTYAIALSAALVAGAVECNAQTAGKHGGTLGPRGGFLVQVDADFGGDDLATVEFDDDTSQDVKAGQGLALSIGGYFRPVETSPFEIEASIGYKYVTTKANNADIHVSRTLLQLDGYYRWPNGFYLGGGLMAHLNPKLSGDGFFEDVAFDTATGVNAEIGWRWISLHYANIKYSNEFVNDIDASHVGLRFTYRFGQRWF